MTFWIRLLVAIAWDLIDALNVIPVLGDVGEVVGGSIVGFLLTGNWKAAVAGAADGILPPPFDFLPIATAVVIADELGWLG